jgi:4-diphosphocytidyl-2-C-methyl-D-erythritol kinase
VPTARVEPAPAKVNLTLRVLGRRPDGYHEIESLVVFAAIGDALTFVPGRELALAVRGPTAAASGEVGENLVLKACRALAADSAGLRLGRFALSKRLPVAAGLGGGSADAAAALRLLARANRIALDDPRIVAAARATGADVPVCIDSRPRMMSGIGEILSRPLRVARLPAVLVNPRVSVPTREVFAALAAPPLATRPRPTAIDAIEGSRAELLAFVARSGNDLEAPALKMHQAIGHTLASLRTLHGCRLARMSGSGATCFALFDSGLAAAAAARALRARHPQWWIRPTTLG